ncbi:hypothetical protein ACIGBL_22535 [Streptomyces sp. NPDC085614]|uniref:hypothetical protein n=1 Tax=Streptomyces sp. NPDC085614 TaxID=3365733 RepID=UPI0037D5D22A
MATGTARRRGLRLAATLTMVMLALTGFQTGSHGGGSGKSKSSSSSGGKSGKSRSGKSDSGSGSGGGCSSSKKNNDDYSHDDEETYDGAGSGGTTATPGVTTSPTSLVDVVVVDCVDPARKKRKGKPARKADTTATLRITSRATLTETFQVTLEFKDAGGSRVDSAVQRITVEAGETRNVEVAMKNPRTVDRVRACWVYDVREQ